MHIQQGLMQVFVKMGNNNDLMLKENQHRLVMCGRMARALNKGDIYLDITGPRMRWRIEKEDKVTHTFHSLDDMEEFLEYLLEKAFDRGSGRLNLEPQVIRRLNVIHAKRNFRTNGTPMVFRSKVNRW